MALLIIPIHAAKRRVKGGEDKVSGLMFAEDFVGISGTPQGLQKQIEKALDHTMKWNVTANINYARCLFVTEIRRNP